MGLHILKFLFLVGIQGCLSQKESRIVSGRNALFGEIPYQVGIRAVGANFTCTGCIIHASYVLTAAHCFTPTQVPSVEIVAGDLIQNLASVTRQVKWIVNMTVHPEYNSSTRYGDIALLKLNSPLKFGRAVGAIPIARSLPSDGALGIVSGWGSTIPQQAPFAVIGMSQQLQVGRVGFYEAGICKQVFGNDTLCTLRRGMDFAGICFGDSGGPLVSFVGNQRQLSGISKMVIEQCGHRDRADVYTDVQYFSEWICKTTGGLVCN